MKKIRTLPQSLALLMVRVARTATAFAAAALVALALSPTTALASEQATNGILVTVSASSGGASGGATTLSSGASLLAEAEDALTDAGIEVTGLVCADDDSVTVQAQPTNGQTDEEALAAAQTLPGVESAQLNYVYTIIEPVEEDGASGEEGASASTSSASAATLSSSATTLLSLVSLPVNDPFAQVSASSSTAPNQYWLYTTGLADAWAALLNASQVNTVTVVTMDTGASASHEDLADNLLTELAYDTANECLLSEDSSTDAKGHGTAVAGVIAAVANNGVGLAGATCNVAQVLPMKVTYDSGELEDSADSASFVRAYQYVFDLIDAGEVDNVRVINISLGAYVSDSDTGESFDQDGALHAAIQEALYDYGILTVCAGGNGNSSTQACTTTLLPGDYDECVCVTALEPDGTNIVWSDYNEYKDISAPGRSIWTTYTHYSALAGGYYSSLSGTSLAAPIVTGTIALMFAVNPGAEPEDVLEALYATAQTVDDPENDRTQTSGSHGALAAADAMEHLYWHAENLTCFVDVSSQDWFYDAVAFVVAEGIMTGYQNSSCTFGPSDAILRQDAALVIYRYLANGETAESYGFTDVAEDYYTAAVNWCAANDIFTGYQDEENAGRFGVGDTLTREQFVTVLWRIAGSPTEGVDESALEELPDSDDVNDYAREAVAWAVSEGVITGTYRDGVRVLAPTASISRSEVAQIIQRAVEDGVL